MSGLSGGGNVTGKKDIDKQMVDSAQKKGRVQQARQELTEDTQLTQNLRMGEKLEENKGKKDLKGERAEELRKVQAVLHSSDSKRDDAEQKAKVFLGSRQKALMGLRDFLEGKYSKENVLKAIEKWYPEQEVDGDLALKFLEETAEDPEIQAIITDARHDYQTKYPSCTNHVLIEKGRELFGDEETMNVYTDDAIHSNLKFRDLWKTWKDLEPRALAVLFDNILHEVGVATKVQGSEVDHAYLSALLQAGKSVNAAHLVFSTIKQKYMSQIRRNTNNLPQEFNFVSFGQMYLGVTGAGTPTPGLILKSIEDDLGLETQ